MMERLRGFPRRFRFPWRSVNAIRRDVDDELHFHLAEKIEALEREGLTLQEAREEALRQFGDLEGTRALLIGADRRAETATRRRASFDDFARDVRGAWRSLSRSPGFTAVAVLVLALGIGTVSAAFTAVNVLMLRPVMIADPDNVLGVFAETTAEPRDYRNFSYPEYAELRERNGVFSDLAAQGFFYASVGEGGEAARRVEIAAYVSANYFQALGVSLAQGRAFSLGEERGEEESTVVVSHDYWVRSGADPALLGSTIRVNGHQVVVVGIAAEGFTGTTSLISPSLWVPLAFLERVPQSNGEALRLQDPRNRSLNLFGRVREGVSHASVASENGRARRWHDGQSARLRRHALYLCRRAALAEFVLESSGPSRG